MGLKRRARTARPKPGLSRAGKR